MKDKEKEIHVFRAYPTPAHSLPAEAGDNVNVANK
jgi:hypothetical protein